MIITRGKYKGAIATPHQAANDWITADVAATEDAPPVHGMVLNPTSLILTAEELEWLREHAGGSFWREYVSKPLEDEPGFKLVRFDRSRGRRGL